MEVNARDEETVQVPQQEEIKETCKRPIDSVNKFSSRNVEPAGRRLAGKRHGHCGALGRGGGPGLEGKSRKDEKKKLIYLSNQVYNLVKEQKSINGNDVNLLHGP